MIKISKINLDYNEDKVIRYFKDKKNINIFLSSLSKNILIVKYESKQLKKNCLMDNLAPNFKIAPGYSNIILSLDSLSLELQKINGSVLDGNSLHDFTQIFKNLLKLIKLYYELNDKKEKIEVSDNSKIFDNSFKEIILLVDQVQNPSENVFISKTKRIINFFIKS